MSLGDELASQECFDELQAADGLELDAVLPPEPCLACRHSKFLHCGEGGACRSEPYPTIAFSKGPWPKCWCPSFTDDPGEARAQVLERGDCTALCCGTNEALDRQDPESAQLLLSAYIRKTPAAERDGIWIEDSVRRIGALRSAQAATSHDQETQGAVQNEFRKLGETWKIAFQGEECSLKGRIGMTYLAVLLRYPVRPMTALELQNTAGGLPMASQSITHCAEASIADDSKGGDSEQEDPSSASQADFVSVNFLDRKVVSDCERRLSQLEAEATDAFNRGDKAKGTAAQDEYDRINNYLKKACDKHGRSRSFSGENEKARISITNAMKRAFMAIEKAGASNTAAYLRDQIGTGSKFLYRDASVHWNL